MIKNSDLILCAAQVFTYSAQYQAPFYGRQDSIAEMEKITENLQPNEALIISQPLGTGKTFLANKVINDGRIPVPRGVNFLTVARIADAKDTKPMEDFPGDVLVVDEADIKTPYKKLQKGLQRLADFMEQSGKKAIIMGDYSLKNPDIAGCLKHQIPLLKFEPLDRAFLHGVLMQRFEVYMKELLDEGFVLDDVIDPALIQLLAPEWMKSVNTFRGMFSMLQTVVGDREYVHYNGEKAYLSLDLFQSYFSRSLDLDSEEQEDYLKLLCQELRSKYTDGSGITRGFSQDELFEIAEAGDLVLEYDDFYDEIITPFAQAGLLVSTGIPIYEDGEFIRRPEPYVPALRLLTMLKTGYVS